MSLQVWLPLTGDLRQQGLSNDIQFEINTGATISNNGKIGQCYNFDGVDDWIQAIHDKTMWSGKSITMMCWFKSDQSATGGIIVDIAADLCLGYTYSNSGIQFRFWRCYPTTSGTRTGHGFAATTFYDADQWHHAAAVFDGGVTKIYVDGALSGTWDYSDRYSNWGPLLGSSYNRISVGKSAGDHSWIGGLVNDVRIYDHALTEQEVKKNAQGLIVHYPLNNNGLGNENLIPNSIDTLVGSSNYNTGTWRLAGSSQMNRSRVAISNSPIGDLSYGFQSVGLQTGPDGSCWGIDGFPRETGVTYTVSAWGRIVGGSTTAAMLGFSLYNATAVSYGGAYGEAKSSDTEYYGNGAYDYAGGKLRPDGKWTRIWRTFTSTASSGNIYIGFNTATTGDDVTLQLCGVKLEKGNKITQWCPNVSDTLYTKMGMNSNIVYDISGFNNNGTSTGSLSTSSETLRYKTATYFDGATYYIQLSDSLDYVYNNVFTISMWINPTIDKRGILLGSYTASGLYTANFELYTGHKLRVHWHNGDVDFNTAAVPLNTWTHIAFVKRNSSSMYVYKNGELFHTASTTFADVAGDIIPRIGKDYRTSGTDVNYKGGISDLRIYTTALSADDIKELYEMGVV